MARRNPKSGVVTIELNTDHERHVYPLLRRHGRQATSAEDRRRSRDHGLGVEGVKTGFVRLRLGLAVIGLLSATGNTSA